MECILHMNVYHVGCNKFKAFRGFSGPISADFQGRSLDKTAVAYRPRPTVFNSTADSGKCH